MPPRAGHHPAPVDVPYQENGGPGVTGDAHVDDLRSRRLTLRRAPGPFDDHHLVALAEAVEGR